MSTSTKQSSHPHSRPRLVIVESPAKCKKIQSFLGPGFIVKSSMGHIRSLNTKMGVRAIDVHKQFQPHFIISPEKRQQVRELQKWARKCSEVIIASDLDREGEAIGYHLTQVLNLDPASTKRIVFNEITQSAIQSAIQKPRMLDHKLIDAQLARQILDFLIGFEVSPILWKFVKHNLSAGRCQSVALKLVHEKCCEVEQFHGTPFVKLSGTFSSAPVKVGDKSVTFDAQCTSKIPSLPKTEALFQQWKSDTCQFTVSSLKVSQSTSQPPPPYITSSIQQDCSSKLHISPKTTMSILQTLYEAGKITYMRTDSKSISKECAQQIRSEVTKRYGASALHTCTRRYSGKNSAHSQEAHECIRPVKMSFNNIGSSFSKAHQAVYELIWKRTMATQMSPLREQRLVCRIQNTHNSVIFSAQFTKTLHLGYHVVYGTKPMDTLTAAQQGLQMGQTVTFSHITAEEKFTTPPTRYTEASLIKDLEKRGIGRPSTFSSIVGKLFDKHYIYKDTSPGRATDVQKWTLHAHSPTVDKMTQTIHVDKYTQKLLITDIGKQVVTFLCTHFDTIMNYDYTNSLENSLDQIAKGELTKSNVLQEAYSSFHPTVESLQSQLNVVKTSVTDRPTFMTDENSGKDVFVYVGRYGPVIQLGSSKSKPTFYPLPKSVRVQSLTPKLVQEFMSLPIDIGPSTTGTMISVKCSNAGFFAQCETVSFPIPFTLAPSHSIVDSLPSLADIRKLHEQELQKQEAKQKAILVSFMNGNITVRQGKYGPYILQKHTGTNKKKKPTIRSIPPSVDVDTITLSTIESLLSQPKVKKFRKYNKKYNKKQ